MMLAPEQHEPYWNNSADEVARSNIELRRACFRGQPESALVIRALVQGGGYRLVNELGTEAGR